MVGQPGTLQYSDTDFGLIKVSILIRTSASSPVSSTASVSLLSGVHSLENPTDPKKFSSQRSGKKTTRPQLLNKEHRLELERLSAHGYLQHQLAIGYPITFPIRIVSHLSEALLLSTYTTLDPRASDPKTRPFKVTEEQRSNIKASIKDNLHLLDPAFCVPSRHALTRYVTSFFGGFHTHMPFIHIPTWQITEHSPELILGIAAIGAQYCFESRASERLFFAGKALIMERLRQDANVIGLPAFPITHPGTENNRPVGNTEKDSSVETIRALIALMGFATWEPKASMVQESFALQGILTQVLRNAGLDDAEEPISPTPSDQPSDGNSLWHEWVSWVKQESTRRSKLIGFSFLHTHSIAYNVYPTLRSNEIGLRLPCSTKEWKAPTPILWRDAAKEVQEPQLFFREALSLLLRNKSESAPLSPIPTPLGNYVLLHGLLQRIHIVRDLSLPVTSSSAVLPNEEVDKLEYVNRLKSHNLLTSSADMAYDHGLHAGNKHPSQPLTPIMRTDLSHSPLALFFH